MSLVIKTQGGFKNEAQVAHSIWGIPQPSQRRAGTFLERVRCAAWHDAAVDSAGAWGYAVRNGWVLVVGAALGILLTALSHYLAVKTGKRGYYYAAVWVVVVVVAAAALLMYGGACGFCKAVVCKPNPVQACGIRLKLSVTLFEIYCECYKAGALLAPLGLGSL